MTFFQQLRNHFTFFFAFTQTLESKTSQTLLDNWILNQKRSRSLSGIRASCVNYPSVTHLLARSHTHWWHPGCWAAGPHWPAACVFSGYRGTQIETTAAWAWWTAARLQQTWCGRTSPKLQLLPLCPRFSQGSLWSEPASRKSEMSVFIEELWVSGAFAFEYGWSADEGRSQLWWIITLKPTITVSADHKVTILVWFNLKKTSLVFKKSFHGRISMMRNIVCWSMCADYLQKNYNQKRYKEPVLWQAEATFHDLNLPEDVNVWRGGLYSPSVSPTHMYGFTIKWFMSHMMED